MKRKLITTAIFLTTLFVFSGLFAQEMTESQADDFFKKAGDFYQQKQYQDAIDAYQKIIYHGYNSAEVHFNLGNCYYKIEEYPEAILHYEKAKVLNPSDKDIDFNIKLANLQIVDKIKPLPEVFYVKWYKTFTGITSSTGWGRFAVIMLWVTLVLAAGFVFMRSPRIKRLSFTAGVLFLFVSLISTLIAFNLKASENKRDEAIVFTESVFVKSSPDTDSKNLFMLHEGTKVKIEESLEGWFKIKIADGNDGWIEEGDLEKI